MTWGYQSVNPDREEFHAKEVMGDRMFWVVEHILLQMVTSLMRKIIVVPQLWELR